MEGERVPLILKNKGNCLFCQSPAPNQPTDDLKPLLHSLQVKQVSKEVKGEEGEPAQFAEVDLQGFEIKTGLCTECGNLNLIFYDLKQKMKACLAKIKAKVKIGMEKDDGGMKYPSLEGAIVKETLSRLNRKEPRVILQDLPLSERSIPPWELPEVKVEVDDQDAYENMSGDVEVVKDVGRNIEDPSSSPITSEFDDPMEGSSSTQSQKGMRKRSNAPDCSMHSQREVESKRPKTVNAPVPVKPSTFKRSSAASPPAKNVNHRENSDGDSVFVASAEPSTSVETAVEEVNGVEINVDAFTFEQASLQARLSVLEANLTATVEAQGIEMKELELTVNKATLEWDVLKESLQQISEEFHKLKAAIELEKEDSLIGTPNIIKETVEAASTANDGFSGNRQVRSPTANPSIAEVVDVDPFPEVEAIIKDDNGSCPAPPVNEQVDGFYQPNSDSIDIKYEFPKITAVPKKKRLGRPPSKKAKSVPPTVSSSAAQPKSYAIKLPNKLEVTDVTPKKDAQPPSDEVDNFIPSNEKSKQSYAVGTSQSSRIRRLPSLRTALEKPIKPCADKPSNKDKDKEETLEIADNFYFYGMSDADSNEILQEICKFKHPTFPAFEVKQGGKTTIVLQFGIVHFVYTDAYKFFDNPFKSHELQNYLKTADEILVPITFDKLLHSDVPTKKTLDFKMKNKDAELTPISSHSSVMWYKDKEAYLLDSAYFPNWKQPLKMELAKKRRKQSVDKLRTTQLVKEYLRRAFFLALGIEKMPFHIPILTSKSCVANTCSAISLYFIRQVLSGEQKKEEIGTIDFEKSLPVHLLWLCNLMRELNLKGTYGTVPWDVYLANKLASGLEPSLPSLSSWDVKWDAVQND